MIYDNDGKELVYWPITGLVEGQDSEHFFLWIDTPAEAHFNASADVRLSIFGRVAGLGGPFVELSGDGIDLSGMSEGQTRFEIYAHAEEPIEEVERVILNVGPFASIAANWAN